MNKYTIHNIRNNLALKRQNEHALDLALLNKVVRHPPGHPYAGANLFSELISIAAFVGTQGRPARLSDTAHLFRCKNFDGFINEITLRPEIDPQRTNLPNFDQIMDRDKVKNRLEEETVGREWIPLNTIAEGDYKSRRLLTWWTKLRLEPSQITNQLCRIGVPRNWLTQDCVLLRCRAAAAVVAQARIPTVLDGFDSEIFLPASYADIPTEGHAIDISSADLKVGEAEFVLGPISVEHIEVRLIRIPESKDTEIHPDTDNPDFLSRLAVYYGSL